MSTVHLVGRFPPPIDGQTLATSRLAQLLQPRHTVRGFNTGTDTAHVQADVQLRLDKLKHYLRRAAQLRHAMRDAPDAPVLWASISPMPLGHWRDVLTTLPAFHPMQPVYAVIHWGNFDRVFRSPWTRWTAAWMVRRVAGFVFLDDSLAARCAPWIPEAKRLVIPNTIGADLLGTDAEVAAKITNGPHEPLRLLFLSNMIPSKGYLDVLEAVRRLHVRQVDVEATFAGGWQSDAEQQDFEKRVAEAGLGDMVTHLGTVRDRTRIKALYAAADVFLLPTYYPTEAQPVTILEAMNAGTPVITTRHAGIPHMVTDQQEALFVPPRAPAAIADAIEQVREADTWRRMATNARQRFLTQFGPGAVQVRWEALLRGETETLRAADPAG